MLLIAITGAKKGSKRKIGLVSPNNTSINSINFPLNLAMFTVFAFIATRFDETALLITVF